MYHATLLLLLLLGCFDSPHNIGCRGWLTGRRRGELAQLFLFLFAVRGYISTEGIRRRKRFLAPPLLSYWFDRSCVFVTCNANERRHANAIIVTGQSYVSRGGEGLLNSLLCDIEPTGTSCHECTTQSGQVWTI